MEDFGEFAQAWQKFEEELGRRPTIYGPTVDDLVNSHAQLGEVLISKLTFPAPDLSVTSEDKQITPEVTVRIYTPPDYTGGKPAGLFIHGGGWVFGDLESEDGFARAVAKGAGLVLVSVDYRLAPAHKYPAALDDCLAAFQWVMSNSSYLNTAPGQVFTIGGSAGGCLALGVALKLIDAGHGESVKGVVALVPVTIHPDACPPESKSSYTAYEDNADLTINTNSAMRTFFDAYAPPPTDPYVSVLLHKNLKSLPRTYIATCTKDTLRDDGRLLKQALDSAGVPNKFDEYVGYPHWFWSFPSKNLEPIIQECIAKTVQGVDFVLSESS